ncbi:MAG: hypothetical protein KatS3mg110_4184 [Pirellulaceae bacterium]|nr:MAG: hypothetical protein KatS3mg110_4184 [Pirellulaceae bacterium]
MVGPVALQAGWVMSSLRVNCPHCQRPIKVRAGAVDEIVECPGCGKRFVVSECLPGQMRPPSPLQPSVGSATRAGNRAGSRRASKPIPAAPPVSSDPVPSSPASRPRADSPSSHRTESRGGERPQAEASPAPKRTWFSFSCPVCDTRLVAAVEEQRAAITCPDCGTEVPVPSNQPPSEARARQAVLPSQKDDDLWQADDYRLEQPAVTRPLLPPLFDVSEQELFGTAERPADRPPEAANAVQPQAFHNTDHDRASSSVPPSNHPAVNSQAEASDRYQAAYRVGCPLCDTRVMVWPEQAGQTVACPDCHTPFTVPRPTLTKRKKPPQPDEGDEIRLLDDNRAPETPGREPSRRRLPTGSPPPAASAAGEKPEPGTPRGAANVQRRPPQRRPSNTEAPLAKPDSVRRPPCSRSEEDKLLGSVAPEDTPDWWQRHQQFLRQPYVTRLLRVLKVPRLWASGVGLAVWFTVLQGLIALSQDNAGLLLVIVVLPLMIFSGILLSALAVSTWMTIVESAANAEDFAKGGFFTDVATTILNQLLLWLWYVLSWLPGAVLVLALSSVPFLTFGWLLAGCLLLSQSIFFPIITLSQMSSEHAFDFFNADVTGALVGYKSGWIRYGLVTALAWIVCAAVLPLVTIRYGWGLFTFIWTLAWMVTGRALGILALETAMPIGPHRRQRRSRPRERKTVGVSGTAR